MIEGQRAWLWAKRALAIGFLIVVSVLLVIQLREIEWAEVPEALGRYRGPILLLALLIAAGSHVLYGMFDQIARLCTGHRLARLRVSTIAFVSYAFNLNMGAMVGGVGFRYRLYSRYGLDNTTVTQVIALSVAANWLGYMVIAGIAFTMQVIELPPGWEIGADGLWWVGIGMLATAVVYLVACGLSPNRAWTVRGHEIVLPSFRIALLQLAISAANWALMGALVYVLLLQQIPYLTVLVVVLISAVAGLLAHIPAGLGVIELVFLSLLGHLLPGSEMIAALLAYRAVYYLLPLAAAVLVYLLLEARANHSTPATD